MRALDTGGLGFVGVHVVRQLADAGCEVVVLDRDTPSGQHASFLEGVPAEVTFVQADLASRADRWQDRVGEVDTVVHAAAVTPLAAGVELSSAAVAVAVNVAGTVDVLEFAAARAVRRVVHVSSGSVYGRPDTDAITEDTPLAPRSVYGITKAASDQLAQRYAELGACPVVIARLSQPYGPMERVTHSRGALSPLHDWLVSALAGQPLQVDPDCLARGRDYLYIGDLAAALVRLALAPVLASRVYNVSNGIRTTLAEVRDRVVAAVGDTGEVAGPVNLPAEAERPVLSAERITADTGWRATTGLDDGVAATRDWLSGHTTATTGRGA